MSGVIQNPQNFADLILSRAYPTWAKPRPADVPTRGRKMYTFLRAIANGWDTIASAARTAAYCHASATCPDDGLDLLGETYGGLARAINEGDAAYREYLARPLDRW